MSRLFDQWREVLSHPAASDGRDHFDLAWAILFTIGTLACGLGVAAVVGGFNG